MFTCVISQAQILNTSFENWTNMGNYSTPVGCDKFNSMTNMMSVYTCEQGAPGIDGQYYLKLKSNNITGYGVILDIAVSGTIDKTARQPASGFAFN